MSLDATHQKFIDFYLQSYSPELAAIKAGYPKEEALSIGIDLLANDEIAEAISVREAQLDKAAANMKMTKEKLLRTLYYQYSQAVKFNKTTDALNILERLAKWSGLQPGELVINPVNLVINNIDEGKI